MISTLASALARGFWQHRALRPVRVSDPDKLLALSPVALPAPSLRRLALLGTLSDKQARRIVRALHALGDLAGLRQLERLLSGGGQRWKASYHNLVVNEGLNHLLDVVLSGGSQDTSWFVGLLDDNAAPGASWTATEIASDDVVAYDEATLQAFTDGGVSSQSCSNTASPAVFTISTNSTVIGGAYLIGTNAKATPAGTLYAAGTFTSGDKTLDDGDVLEVSATFSAAAS